MTIAATEWLQGPNDNRTTTKHRGESGQAHKAEALELIWMQVMETESSFSHLKNGSNDMVELQFSQACSINSCNHLKTFVSSMKRNKYTWFGAFLCFLCGSAGKESACSVGNLGLIPGLGRSPGEGKGYPLQYSDLENSMDCIVHGVAKSRTWLSDFHFTSLFSYNRNILSRSFQAWFSGSRLWGLRVSFSLTFLTFSS